MAGEMETRLNIRKETCSIITASCTWALTAVVRSNWSSCDRDDDNLISILDSLCASGRVRGDQVPADGVDTVGHGRTVSIRWAMEVGVDTVGHGCRYGGPWKFSNGLLTAKRAQQLKLTDANSFSTAHSCRQLIHSLAGEMKLEKGMRACSNVLHVSILPLGKVRQRVVVVVVRGVACAGLAHNGVPCA